MPVSRIFGDFGPTLFHAVIISFTVIDLNMNATIDEEEGDDDEDKEDKSLAKGHISKL